MALCFEGASLLTHSPVTHVLGGSEQQPLHEPQPGCWWMPEAAMGMSRLSGRFTLRYWGCGTHQHSCRKTGSYQSRHRFLGTLCLLCRLFLSTSGCLQQCPERHLCGRQLPNGSETLEVQEVCTGGGIRQGGVRGTQCSDSVECAAPWQVWACAHCHASSWKESAAIPLKKLWDQLGWRSIIHSHISLGKPSSWVWCQERLKVNKSGHWFAPTLPTWPQHVWISLSHHDTGM